MRCFYLLFIFLYIYEPIAALPEMSSAIRTAFVRALTVAERASEPRPKTYRHLFELLKLAGGWNSSNPTELTSRLYRNNSYQETMYTYLHEQIVKRASLKQESMIRVGFRPLTPPLSLIPSTDLQQIYEQEDHTFLDGHVINFDFRPSFPIVLVNFRAASSSRIRFGSLLEEAFRCRTVKDFRRQSALMNFWDPREHLTLFTLPAGKRVIGKFGLVGSQSSYRVLDGRIQAENDFLEKVLKVPPGFFRDEIKNSFLRQATEYFNGGALQFYIYAAEESYVCDLGSVHPESYTRQYSLAELMKKAEETNNIVLSQQLRAYQVTRWKEFLHILTKLRAKEKDYSLFLPHLLEDDYIWTDPAMLESSPPKRLHLLDPDYDRRQIFLEDLMHRRGLIDDDILQGIRDVLKKERHRVSSEV